MWRDDQIKSLPCWAWMFWAISCNLKSTKIKTLYSTSFDFKMWGDSCFFSVKYFETLYWQWSITWLLRTIITPGITYKLFVVGKWQSFQKLSAWKIRWGRCWVGGHDPAWPSSSAISMMDLFRSGCSEPRCWESSFWASHLADSHLSWYWYLRASSQTDGLFFPSDAVLARVTAGLVKWSPSTSYVTDSQVIGDFVFVKCSR